MKKLVFPLMFLLSLQAFAAAKGSISQIKGKKAIVIFDEAVPFSVGQKLFLNSAEGSDVGTTLESRNLLERRNAVNLLGSYSSLKPKDGDTTTEISLSGSYTWNLGQYEYGPIVAFSSTDTDGSGTSSSSFGGYLDYNLEQNISGQEMVWGAVARITAGTLTSKTSSGKDSASLTTIDLGAQAKFFQFSQVLAIRTELIFQNQKVEDEERTGLVLNIGLQHYY